MHEGKKENFYERKRSDIDACIYGMLSSLPYMHAAITIFKIIITMIT